MSILPSRLYRAILTSNYTQSYWRDYPIPRTKGSKNRVTASTDFDAQIAKLQKDKATLEESLSKTVAHIEELKTDIKSLRESLKPQKAEIKQTEKEMAKLEVKKAAAEAKAAEAAKKGEAEAVLKKLLASGMTADEILEKLKQSKYAVWTELRKFARCIWSAMYSL